MERFLSVPPFLLWEVDNDMAIGDVLEDGVAATAWTLGGIIVRTWNPWTTTGRVSDDSSVGITRIEEWCVWVLLLAAS